MWLAWGLHTVFPRARDSGENFARGLDSRLASYVPFNMTMIDTPIRLIPDLPCPFLRSERDRDFFDLEDGELIVASDRISVSGSVLPDAIPDKGRILTRIAAFWFDATRDIAPNHLIAADVRKFPEALQAFRESLEGRSLLVEKIRPLPVGGTVHGCLAGRAYEEFQATGSICGFRPSRRIKLAGLLPEPIFTPFLRTEDGQRRGIGMSELVDRVGVNLTRRLKDCSLSLYMRGYHLAWERGIILADARFEFGLKGNGSLVLVDEVLTPGASSYWAQDQWKPGVVPHTIDQRRLQEHLATLSGREGTPPAPRLPEEVIEAIRASYLDLAARFGIRL